jgi:hypothetical protein
MVVANGLQGRPLEHMAGGVARVTDEETRSVSIKVRIRPSLKEALERLSKADDRTLATYVERILTAHVAQHDKIKRK